MSQNGSQEHGVPHCVSVSVINYGGENKEAYDLFAAYLRAHTPEQLVADHNLGYTAQDWGLEQAARELGVPGHRVVPSDRAGIRCHSCSTRQAVRCFYHEFTSPSGRKCVAFDYKCYLCSLAYLQRVRRDTGEASPHGDEGGG